MKNTLRENNHKVINALLEDYNIDPEVILRELLENYMSSSEAFNFLSMFTDENDISEDFPQFRDLDDTEDSLKEFEEGL